jgi:hypothetical protein
LRGRGKLFELGVPAPFEFGSYQAVARVNLVVLLERPRDLVLELLGVTLHRLVSLVLDHLVVEERTPASRPRWVHSRRSAPAPGFGSISGTTRKRRKEMKGQRPIETWKAEEHPPDHKEASSEPRGHDSQSVTEQPREQWI